LDIAFQKSLIRLIKSQSVASLGSLRDGGPQVTMVTYTVVDDFSAFTIFISRLAHHTQNLLADSRASLMIVEENPTTRDPQEWGRVSIIGTAEVVVKDSPHYQTLLEGHIKRFPRAAFNIQLGDFELFEMKPTKARYVAGFGAIFNLDTDSFEQLGKLEE